MAKRKAARTARKAATRAAGTRTRRSRSRKTGAARTKSRQRTAAKTARKRAGASPTRTRAATKPARARVASKATRTRTATKTARTRVAPKTARARAVTKPSATTIAKSTLTAAAQAVKQVVARTATAVADLMPRADARPDAIELLERDHRRLEALLAQGEETTERAVTRRAEILESLTTLLNAHEMIEEKLLYPALKPHAEARAIVLEGYQEHHVADLIVTELHAMDRTDERWGAKFKVLKENIEHHIEEEEGEMFKTARSVMSREQLQELGARMEDMKTAALAR